MIFGLTTRFRPPFVHRFNAVTPKSPAPYKFAHSQNGEPKGNIPLPKTMLNSADHNGPAINKVIVLISPIKTYTSATFSSADSADIAYEVRES